MGYAELMQEIHRAIGRIEGNQSAIAEDVKELKAGQHDLKKELQEKIEAHITYQQESNRRFEKVANEHGACKDVMKKIETIEKQNSDELAVKRSDRRRWKVIAAVMTFVVVVVIPLVVYLTNKVSIHVDNKTDQLAQTASTVPVHTPGRINKVKPSQPETEQ